MRRRVVARVAPISALVLLLASVVLCPARCLAGQTGDTAAAPPPCHHAPNDSPPSHDGGLPPVAHATCCVVALSSPAAAPAPVTVSAAAPVTVPQPVPAVLASPVVDARIDGRAAPPPTPLYLRLRTLLV
jgi:hypothetical protein